MIPLKDDNPRTRVPVVTIGLIILNIVAFYFQIKLGYDAIIKRYALLPADVLRGENLETIFTSMFLHGGYLHLGGNMLYLWIFGDNVENHLGHLKFLFFYLACGVLADVAHIYFSTNHDVALVGASGAISGVLGAYLVKYPRAQVLVVIPIIWFLTIRRIPAIIVLSLWFVIQVVSGVVTLGMPGGGVAFWAHVGGFVAGLLLILVIPKSRHAPPTRRDFSA